MRDLLRGGKIDPRAGLMLNLARLPRWLRVAAAGWDRSAPPPPCGTSLRDRLSIIGGRPSG
jgi:hypothetical protein